MSKNPLQFAMVLGAVLGVAVVLFLGWQMILVPWQDFEQQLSELDIKIGEKNLQIANVKKERAQLERFEQLSLPTDVDEAQLEYHRFLDTLMSRHNFRRNGPGLTAGANTSASQPGQKSHFGSKKSDPIYTALNYKIDAHATVANLAALLKDFHETPLMHRIRTMTLKPVDPDSRKKEDYLLNVQMDIEALIVEGAAKRSQTLLGADERLVQIATLTLLKGGPGALALIPWEVGHAGSLVKAVEAKAKADKRYDLIAKNNIFIGYQPPKKPDPPPPPKPPEPKKMIDDEPEPDPEPDYDMREFYKLIHITKTHEYAEAWLYSPYNDKFTRLKTSNGFNRITIKSESGITTLLLAFVVKIDYGRVYIQEAKETKSKLEMLDKYYCIEPGQNLYEATRKALPHSELIKAGLKTETASKTQSLEMDDDP